MLQMLKEVEQGLYDAILCMDIDRLGRGNMQEQGLILETFKKSNTQIITPRKTYDLHNEWDEEYSEFEAFMARKELKLITRRLQQGRTRSIEEGNYLSPLPPYGYLIEQKGKGNRYLIPHPNQAHIVQTIFQWYTDDNFPMGAYKIANELNAFGYKSYKDKSWTGSSVINILKNPAYAGFIRWKMKDIKKSPESGKKKTCRTRPKSEWIVVPGRHQPLVPEEIFKRAQDILKTKYHVPYKLENGMTNPLAGLIKCGMCGSSMVLRTYVHQTYPHLICYNRECSNKSSRFRFVEQRLLEGLTEWLCEFKADWSLYKPQELDQDTVINIGTKALKCLERELQELEGQKQKLCDLLERGIYDDSIYFERSQNLADRILTCRNSIQHTHQYLQRETQKQSAPKETIPTCQHVLDLYDQIDDPVLKNNLIKSVLDKAVYYKKKIQKADNFTLIIYPKLSKLKV